MRTGNVCLARVSHSLDMDHEETSVMGYMTLFEGSGIQNSNTRLHITHMYINGYFILLFDLTPDLGHRRFTRHSLRMAIS